MNQPTTTDINRALESIAATERPVDHARSIAQRLVQRYRQATAIDPDYDFNAQPRELRQIAYNATVRFSRRRLWSRILR